MALILFGLYELIITATRTNKKEYPMAQLFKWEEFEIAHITTATEIE
jgi:hypothetical protein